MARDEKELFVFNTIGFDLLDNPNARIDWRRATPIMQECVLVSPRARDPVLEQPHRFAKAESSQSDDASLDAARRWEQDGTLASKKSREDWGLLGNDWKNSTRH